MWSRESGELIFLGGTPGSPKALMAVPIRLAQDVVIGAPVKLFDIGENLLEDVDLAPDAKRFVMIRRHGEDGSQPGRWILMQNWLADLAPAR
jgi:hypothetical protein